MDVAVGAVRDEDRGDRDQGDEAAVRRNDGIIAATVGLLPFWADTHPRRSPQPASTARRIWDFHVRNIPLASMSEKISNCLFVVRVTF